MSVKRGHLPFEGKNHSIYTNGIKTILVKRHRTLKRIIADELCKPTGLSQSPEFLGCLTRCLLCEHRRRRLHCVHLRVPGSWKVRQSVGVSSGVWPAES